MTPGGAFVDRYGPPRALFLMGMGAALFAALTAAAGRPGLGEWIGVFASFLIVRLALDAISFLRQDQLDGHTRPVA
jgi:hypothetical protein